MSDASTTLPARTREGRTIKPRFGVGAPTLYSPDYCALAERMARESGASPAQIAARIGVAKQTLFKWGQEHPEFGDALSRAKTYEQAHWEELGKRALPRKHFQAQVYRQAMASRFRDDYTEGKTVDVTFDLSSLTKEALLPPAEAKAVDVVVDKMEQPAPAASSKRVAQQRHKRGRPSRSGPA